MYIFCALQLITPDRTLSASRTCDQLGLIDMYVQQNFSSARRAFELYLRPESPARLLYNVARDELAAHQALAGLPRSPNVGRLGFRGATLG